MALKSFLKKTSTKVLSDPRTQALMQDERFTKAMMKAIQVKQQAQDALEQQIEEVADSLNIVTKNELKELKRNMKKMERELKRTKSELEAAKKAAEPKED